MNQESKNENSQYTISVLESEGIVQFHFAEKETAQSMLQFLHSFFPILEDHYPRVENNSVIVTSDQYHFYRLFISHSREGLLSELIPDHYFIKTLRADEFDYSHAFIKGLFPGEHGLRRQNLRPSERKQYLITPQGEIVERAKRKPKHMPSEKAQYSQIQSCTFIDKETQSRAFGFSQVREIRLYGLLTHENDVLIHRGLIRDSGTVGRVFEHEYVQSAKESHFHRESKGEKILYSHEEFEAFKRANLIAREKEYRTNEFLARLRFNPYRSVVSICSDTLEARLLAYHFAQELLKELKDYASRHNIKINPNFRIPILFYLPERIEKKNGQKGLGVFKHRMMIYSEAMQRKDQDQALAILNTPALKNKKYKNGDYEFLLGLDEITSQHLLDEVAQGVSLAEQLLRSKRGRLLLRLLESRNTKTAEVTQQVFTTLIQKGRIKQNDGVISELIKIEAFEIAETVIKDTKTNIRDSNYIYGPLAEWIIQHGNPRHMNFMGLKEMLLMASFRNRWVIIKLCLKEYPGIDIDCLGSLLLDAYKTKHYIEAGCLLEMGAAQSLQGKVAFKKLIQEGHGSLVSIFLRYQPRLDLQDYCFGLKECIKHYDTDDLVMELLNLVRRNFEADFNQVIGSSILLVIAYRDTIECLQKIFKNLSKNKTKSEVVETLIRLAHDCAEFRSDQKAMRWLEGKYSYVLTQTTCPSLFDMDSLFIESMVDGEDSLKQFIIKYGLLALEKLTKNCSMSGNDFQKDYYEKYVNKFLQVITVEELEPIICDLILTEKFEMAQVLIERTNVDVGKIKYHDDNFIHYLVVNGTPQQINFIGFDKVLLDAADEKNWELIRGCVIEYAGIDKMLLTQLLYKATYQGASKEVNFLLHHGIDLSITWAGNGAIVASAQKKDWETVTVFTQFPADEKDSAEYGFALLEAFRNKEVNVALKLLDAGAKPFCREFQCGIESTLYFAVEQGLNDLLPKLINFESQGEHTRAFYSRCFIARDLAHATHNAEAAQILDKFIEHMPAVDTQNSLQSIARLFIQALYLKRPDLAVYRLIHYLQQYNHLDRDDHNPVKGIALILEFIDSVYGELPGIAFYDTSAKIFKQIIKILLEKNGLSILYSVYQSDNGPVLFRDNIFYCILLNEINEECFESIHELSKIITSDEGRRIKWQRILDERFHEALTTCNHEKSYCLVRLGAQPNDTAADDCKGTTSLAIAAFDGNEKVVEYLLTHFDFTQELKTQALSSAAKSGWPTRVTTLLLEHDTELTPEIVQLAASRGEEFILRILDGIDYRAINSSEYQLQAYALWCSGYSRPRVQAKLSTLLDSDWIIHYTLMHVYSIFELSLDNKRYDELLSLFRGKIPGSKHLFNFLCKECIRDCNTNQCSIVDPLNLFYNVTSIMYNYFSFQENVLSELPNEKLIHQTYQAIRSELEQIASSVKHVVSSINIPFFKPVDNSNEFIACMRAYLSRVDQLLVHKKKLQRDEAVPALTITEQTTIPGMV